MQERYLGDIHDYFKFLFLKFLSNSLETKIGLNWFLIKPEDIGQKEVEKNDGEKRKYLYHTELQNYDETLISELKLYQDKKKRDVVNFTKNTHLRKHINFFNKVLTHSNKAEWLEESLIKLKNEKIIFLDPDNGFSKNQKGRKSIKYLFPEDCSEILRQNKIIIFTQFQSFTIKHKEYIKILKKKLNDSNFTVFSKVIRNRTAPNTFYITILPNENSLNLHRTYEEYSKKFSRTEIVS